MNSKNCTQEYLFLPTESSFGPPASTASNLASIPPQGMSVLDGRWSGTRSFDIPDRQVDAEKYSASLRPSSHSTILPIGTAGKIHLPETPIAACHIYNEGSPYSPLTCLSETDTTCQSMISSCTSLKSSMLESQGSWPTSFNSNEISRDNIFAEADTTRNQRRGGTLMNAQHRSFRKDPAAASSKSPLKPDKEREARPSQERPKCNICGKDYKQGQGVARHQRDEHEISLCLICNDFRWSRPYQLAKHLKKQHPGIHLSPAQRAEITRCRRKDTIRKTHLQKLQASPPAMPQPLMPPLLPVLEHTHISSPSVSCVAFDPQHEPTMPAITDETHRRELEHELAFLDAYFALYFTEGCVPPPNAVDDPFWV